MRQRFRAARQDESGFTLIELLIVIVILGVLAGIVVFAVNGITDRGVTAACKADVATVQVASEAYNAKNAGYATGIAALVTDGLLRAPAPNEVDGTGKYFLTYTAATGAVVGNLTGKTSNNCA